MFLSVVNIFLNKFCLCSIKKPKNNNFLGDWTFLQLSIYVFYNAREWGRLK